jgi:hypothetical protein
MSKLQYGTLRFLVHHQVDVEHLGTYNLTTLGSLIVRGWVHRNGTRITVTKTGEEAYMDYHRAGPNYKLHAGELSERVRGLLHVSQLRMVKAAS